jgi:putative transposase
MARLPRYVLPGVPQHVIQRGNNRQPIFAADGDYRTYLTWLKAAADQHGLLIHAYVLMTNHVHLLATPEQEDSIGKTLQSLGRRYVQYFNYSYGRTGTLWEGRYRATVVQAEDYLLTCSCYIELNPVRAGMVKSPAHYRYSSYRHNAQGRADPLLTTHEVYRRMGRTVTGRAKAYRALFLDAVEEAALQEIRAATNTGWALGDDGFHKERPRAIGETTDEALGAWSSAI